MSADEEIELILLDAGEKMEGAVAADSAAKAGGACAWASQQPKRPVARSARRLASAACGAS